MRSGQAPSLSLRDTEILDALVHRVRVFSVPQVGRTWWAGSTNPTRNALNRLTELQRHGLAHVFPALVHPELPMLEPVTTWKPGDPPPHFGEVSYQLRKRWTKAPKHLKCVVATKSAGEHFGGSGGRLPREMEQTHDVHLSAVFLQFRSRFPELVKHWLSEAAILRSREDRSEKLPDAVIELDTGPRVIEFGGAYSKEKVASFHEYCSENRFPYELW